jgi:hypothetical protein
MNIWKIMNVVKGQLDVFFRLTYDRLLDASNIQWRSTIRLWCIFIRNFQNLKIMGFLVSRYWMHVIHVTYTKSCDILYVREKKVFLNIIFAYRPFPVSIQYGFFLMKLTFVKYHIGISAPLFLCSRFFSTRLTCQPKNFEQVLDNDGKIRLQRVT